MILSYPQQAMKELVTSNEQKNNDYMVDPEKEELDKYAQKHGGFELQD